MSEYKTIDIAPETSPKYDPYAAMNAQSQMQNANESAITNQLLEQIIRNQEQELKQLKGLRSYGAIIALVAGIQLIGWILSLMGVIRLFG